MLVIVNFLDLVVIDFLLFMVLNSWILLLLEGRDVVLDGVELLLEIFLNWLGFFWLLNLLFLDLVWKYLKYINMNVVIIGLYIV